MLFTLEEIGIELLMVLATGGAVVCFVWLLTITLTERRELRRLSGAGGDRTAPPVDRHS